MLVLKKWDFGCQFLCGGKSCRDAMVSWRMEVRPPFALRGFGVDNVVPQKLKGRNKRSRHGGLLMARVWEWGLFVMEE